MALEVSLNYSPVVNFAMQQNHAPVIQEIKLLNNGEEAIEDIRLEISFEPAFAIKYTTHLECIAAGCEEVINVVSLSFSTEFLSSLTERIMGAMELVVSSKDDTLFRNKYEISVLAFNEWSGIQVLPEMLAAFSTPNHPEVTRIIKRASVILGEWTDSPSLDEYQTRDPNRVKFQMAALYKAISEEEITYSAVPASFEKTGQRLRLSDEIITTKLGNCIDMSMLYVSCLEAMGLHPIVVISKGHAYAGCWLVGDSFPDSVNDDPSLLTKRIANGINEMLVVETTCMNSGSEATFDSACQLAFQKLDSNDFLLFIDVFRARIGQIRPLPLRVAGPHGWILIDDEKTAKKYEAPEDISTTDIIIDSKADVDKKTIWERKLLDLSLRNNLLNTRLTREAIPIISVHIDELEDALADNHDFQVLCRPQDWDNPQISEGIYKAINAADPVYELVKLELSQNRLRTYFDEEKLRKALTHLYRSSRTALEENGANTLYLALGLLKWYETPSSKKPRFAPILLVPVEIIRKSAASGYIIRSRDEETLLNITLLELLRQAFNITIGGLDPLPTDSSGVDVSLVFNTIRRKIMNQRGWDVIEQAILGNFSFNKFIMWNDIHNNSNILAQNKIVSSLITGIADASVNQEIVEEPRLDEKFGAGDIMLPISADSSQLEAINAALSGKSFILHGPPGTGKSQTITNIIANALYRGKRVLFVAEKMAALEVVQNRLESIGLGAFCLELHSNKAKKSNVLEQLKRTSEVAKKKSSEAYAEEAKHINEVRSEINQYNSSMHRPYPLGVSLFDCISRYYSIPAETPEFVFSVAGVSGLDANKVAGIEVALSEFKTACSLIGSPTNHPLVGISLSEYSSDAESAFESLSELASNGSELHELSKAIQRSLFGIDNLSLTHEQYDALKVICSIILSNKELIPSILAIGNEDSLHVIEDACVHGKERDRYKDEILSKYDDGILALDTVSFESQWREASAKGFISRYFAQNKLLRFLQTYSKFTTKPNKELVLPLLRSLQSYKKEDDSLHNLLSSIGSNVVLGDKTSWDKIIDSCDKARTINVAISCLSADRGNASKMRDHLGEHISGGLMNSREREGHLLQDFVELIDKINNHLDVISRNLSAAIAIKDGDWAEVIANTAQRWSQGKEKLRSWILYNQRRETICSKGFEDIIDQIESGSIPLENLLDSFHKGLFKTYAEYILTQEKDLNIFHGLMFEEKISRFRGLCKDFETLTREEIFAKLASSLPALQREASQNSEVGILQRNIRNGCRGLSLRKFFDMIPDLLPRLSPCMLMSPISVAQYIDSKAPKFDLVIFDEASQMPTCEAVGAIARGKCIIVVGDPKQMPPTNFFSTNSFDEDNAAIEDLESILDDCLALSLPSKYLRWHYRSKHESLIAFSNSKYYDNKLLTFPSPDDIDTKLQYQYVKGIYDRGGSRQNRAEAEAIVAEIKKRLRNPKLRKQSIGVVTFNSNQQSLIEDLLTDMFAANPDLEKIAMDCDEHIFIKNLENVQGDERDVILFSVGYGEDKEGKIALNFGPLNRDGGWRRLNVAVSRARYEMKVFSTLRSEQIDLKRTRAEGVAGLKSFLEYAEKGRQALKYNTAAASIEADGLVEDIASEIRKLGYDVRTNIGCSGYRIDIGIVNPENHTDYILGILCDGYNYISSKSSRDREIVQIGILRKLGWKIARVWTMDWWNDKNAVLANLTNKIKLAISGELTEDEEQPLRLYSGNTNSTIGDVQSNGNDDDHTKDSELGLFDSTAAFDPNAHRSENYTVEFYQPCYLNPHPLNADDFVKGYRKSLVLDYLQQVIDKEAPISENLLCKRVLRALDIARMGNRVSAYMNSLFKFAKFKTTKDSFVTYWKEDQDPDSYSIIRYSNAREASDIPVREACNAALLVLEEQGSQPSDSLIREMAKLFGYSRVGDNVYFAMLNGIEFAKKKGQIKEVGDRIKKKD